MSSKIFAFLKSALHDLLLIASLSSFTYGFYEIYNPLGYIVGGALLFWIFSPGRKQG